MLECKNKGLKASRTGNFQDHKTGNSFMIIIIIDQYLHEREMRYSYISIGGAANVGTGCQN